MKMIWFCLAVALLCPLSHQSDVLDGLSFLTPEQKQAAKDRIKAAEEAAAANEAMWQEFSKLLGEWDTFRKGYATKIAKLMGDVTTKIMNSDDDYFKQSQDVYESVSLVVTLLKAYLKVGKVEAVKKPLTNAFDKAASKLDVAETKLTTDSKSFGSFSSNLSVLKKQIDADFVEKKKVYQAKFDEMRAANKGGPNGAFEKELVPSFSDKLTAMEKFYNDLTQKANNDLQKINGQKAKLQSEIELIVDLKQKIDAVKASMNSESSDDNSDKAENDLIDAITKYQDRRNNSND